MKKTNQMVLVIVSYIALLIAILSGFTTVVGYTNSYGVHKDFMLLDFLLSSEFDSFVMQEYHGSIVWNIDITFVRVMAVIAVIAVLCAVIGLKILSEQRKNTWPFVLTLVGLVGTMIPSILLFVCIVVLKNSYVGTISCGIYPIVSPIAMIISIYAATQAHRKNIEYQMKLRAAEGLIRRGGNL